MLHNGASKATQMALLSNVVCVAFVCSGEGQFGKVYTAVNMETANLMAMKEVGGMCVMRRQKKCIMGYISVYILNLF